ncbi:hypothetical protein QMS86_01430 [Cronobacter dublinensis]
MQNKGGPEAAFFICVVTGALWEWRVRFGEWRVRYAYPPCALLKAIPAK